MRVALRDDDPVSQGPAGRGFEASMRRALSAAMAAWQVVVMVAVLVTETRIAEPVLVVAHLAAIALCLLVMAGRVPLLPVLVAMYALWFLDYLACTDIDGALLLAACWLGNLVYAVAAVLLRRWLAVVVPVGGAIAVGTGLVLLHPDWPVDLSTTFVVTSGAIVVAAQLAMPVLRGLAADADQETHRAAEDGRQREASRRASREAAEDARLVHDTVVNTLGAVANGVRADLPPEAVRERCRADAQRISGLLAGRRDVELPSLGDIEHEDWGLAIVRDGMVGDELRRQEALVGPETLRALHGATRELVRNATKHADVDRVVVSIDRRGDRLEVTVEDEGVGFDVGDVPLRGLDRSVRQRLDDVGGEVHVTSEPGRGTRARLRAPLATAAPTAVEAESKASRAATEVVDGLRERAAWMWSGSVIAVGFAIELVNRPGQLTATYLMLTLMVTCALLVRWDTRGDGHLSGWTVGVLVAAVVPAFVAAAAGVDFGRTDVVYYQAIGFTPLPVLLMTFRGAHALRAALAVLVVTAAVMSGILWPSDRDAAVSILVAMAPALGLGLGWLGFHRLVGDLVLRAESEREASALARTEVAARAEIVAARRRWRAAGLAPSSDLLEAIADAHLDPRDPEVRRRCAAEEAYLRQLIQLSPESYRMSAWFARALAESRHRDVQLLVRGGEVDAPDDATAAVLGHLVVTAVAEAAPGGRVVAGLFSTREAPRLVVVGDPGHLDGTADDLDPESWQRAYTRLPDQDVLEVSLVGRTSELVP